MPCLVIFLGYMVPGHKASDSHAAAFWGTDFEFRIESTLFLLNLHLHFRFSETVPCMLRQVHARQVWKSCTARKAERSKIVRALEVGMLSISGYAFHNGDPRRLTRLVLDWIPLSIPASNRWQLRHMRDSWNLVPFTDTRRQISNHHKEGFLVLVSSCHCTRHPFHCSTI